jgi:hypothetical protein
MDKQALAEKKSQRRPRAKEIGTLVSVRLQPDALAALDDWRRRQPDCPNRPEALRRRSNESAALRGALEKIAKEQSFMSAQLAADTFQKIAREALSTP